MDTPAPVAANGLPSGPTPQQNPALIADVMNHLIQDIGFIMLHRINDPTFIVPDWRLSNIRQCTLGMGPWSMTIPGISANCEIQDAGLDTPSNVILTMHVYTQTWVYVIKS